MVSDADLWGVVRLLANIHVSLHGQLVLVSYFAAVAFNLRNSVVVAGGGFIVFSLPLCLEYCRALRCCSWIGAECLVCTHE